MPDDLWRDDIVTWSEQQSDRLRRLRAGERVNDLDWDHIIEEIESLGRREIEAVRSLLVQAVLHLMKLHAWPGHPAARKWRVDAADFLIQAQDGYRPSMARSLDLAGAVGYARRRLPVQRFTTPAQDLPPLGAIPLAALADPAFTLEDLEAALFPPA
ncbi:MULTISPECIES: DUF29 family protein [Roseomonadaceae]|uniref:DUF29 family protein n=1 Tax=Falsiroseomonas oleicola TaxID=2801474 RepID=A0ABS6H4V2_9PROT|nr:DUF29 family protein [Roseomonas oleicola]MBU8542768.1 DUF29 family protein [Roseomonas oleicola]